VARRLGLLALSVVLISLLASSGGFAAKPKPKPKPKKPTPVMSPAAKLATTKHFVIIYEENHSFDNLYGGWEGVNGVKNAGSRTTQVNQAGTPYTCLKMNDVNLTSPPLAATCNDTTTATPFASAFANAPFTIDSFIPATAVTCPPTLKAFSFPNGLLNGDPQALPGGCTRDIVHRFYQEIYQLDGGKQDRYVTGSDSMGLVMGGYDTKVLPVYKYLHTAGHPRYAIEDDFFQGAFGGSFLNHQWLIAAATPTYAGAPDTLHSIVDSAGFPNASYGLYKPATTVRDGPLTVACPAPIATLACGDFAVNTMQPSFLPAGAFGAKLIPQTSPTIADRLSEKHIGWAWYSGGWSNANGDTTQPGWTNGSGPKCSDPNADPVVSAYPHCPNNLFQYHHQPFNYFAAFSTATESGQINRNAHLKDEQEFIQLAQSSTATCQLKTVSFVKPIGQENEHPGYASEPNGSSHLVLLLKAIEGSKCAKDTLVIVTYDEFGGQWDHVPPPGQGGTAGPHDQWGPGSRVPALVISPLLSSSYVVDHTQHDTTSILATIEHRYKLQPLGTRDAAVKDLSTVFSAKAPTG
jgi:acid phosphatase